MDSQDHYKGIGFSSILGSFFKIFSPLPSLPYTGFIQSKMFIRKYRWTQWWSYELVGRKTLYNKLNKSRGQYYLYFEANHTVGLYVKLQDVRKILKSENEIEAIKIKKKYRNLQKKK